MKGLFSIEPQLAEYATFGPEPCLRSILFNYYCQGSDRDDSKKLTDKYINAIIKQIEDKPQPGDKIICMNGKEFTCCTLNFIRDKLSLNVDSDKPIVGYSEHIGWQGWYYNGSANIRGRNEYDIREVIPKQQEKTVQVKTEETYTAEDIRKAIIGDRGWSEDTLELIMKSLEKVTSKEYGEYLRLKAMFESEEE